MTDESSEDKGETFPLFGDDQSGSDFESDTGHIISREGSYDAKLFNFIRTVNPNYVIHYEIRSNWYKPYKHHFLIFHNGKNCFRVEFSLCVVNHERKLRVNCSAADLTRILGTRLNEIKIHRSHLNRLESIIGMNNYHLYYRNCEHICNYIMMDVWMSPQIMGLIKLKLVRYRPELVDQPPFKQKFIVEDLNTNSPLSYEGKTTILDESSKKSRNIIMFGGSGVGKSNLINHLVKKVICLSKASPRAITHLAEFVRARKRDELFTLIDTIGVNSSNNWDAVFESLKGRITIDLPIMEAWLIVKFDSRMDDITKERVRSFYDWVTRNKFFESCKLIMTHCNGFEVNDRERIKHEFLEEIDDLGIQYLDYSLASLIGSNNRFRDPECTLGDKLLGWINVHKGAYK